MSNHGEIGWMDLTVPDARAVRNFYKAVVGWKSVDEPMGDYADFSMVVPTTGETVAGICHARGANEHIPPQWLLYITVEDIDKSLKECEASGGAVVQPAREMGSYGRVGIIRDPAGAVCALWQKVD